MVALVALLACSDKSIALGQGVAPDARFIADMYTWDCSSASAEGGPEVHWEGVHSYRLSLEYAPDTLVDRSVPESGCAKGVDLFPIDAGAAAVDLEGDPTWSNGAFDGRLTQAATGLWTASAFTNQNSCMTAEELLGEGTLLGDADPFSGARTPAPGVYDDVSVSDFDERAGLPFGADVTVTWDAEGWDTSWVQVRRERGGALLESVTCATTGANALTIGADVWGEFNGAVEADVNNLYVGVERTKLTEAEDGQKIELVTRAMHIAVLR
jgi:hypothetical protein